MKVFNTVLVFIVVGSWTWADAKIAFNKTNEVALKTRLSFLREDHDIKVPLGYLVCSDPSSESSPNDLEISFQAGSGLLRTNPSGRYYATVYAQAKLLDYENNNDPNLLTVEIVCSRRGDKDKTNADRDIITSKIVLKDANDERPYFERDNNANDVYDPELDETISVADLPYTFYRDIFVKDKDLSSANNKVTAQCNGLKNEFTDELTPCDGLFSVVAVPIAGEAGSYRFEIRAETSQYDTKKRYNLQISAVNIPLNTTSDKTLVSEKQNVLILIRDLQNLNPVFELTEQFTMKENTPIGTVVDDRMILAHDQDVGDPNKIRFKLIQNPNDNFALSDQFKVSGDKNYGVYLVVNRLIDRESLTSNSKLLEVEILAEEYDDTGRPNRNPGNATHKVVIRILDENDEKPTFNKDTFVISFSELPNSDEVEDFWQIYSNIIVTDHDSADYNSFDTSFISGNENGLFKLDRQKGAGQKTFILYALTGILDYERPITNYEFVLKVEDRDNSSLSSTATVRLNILDVNDNKPTFSQSVYNFPVKENSPIGTIIGTVTASDSDSNENGRIAEYKIETVDPIFTIDEFGTIRLNGSVDHEVKQSYLLKVVARDGGEDPQEDSVYVQIRVENIPDNGPVFVDLYVADLFEESKELIPELTIQATNPEGVGNIRYDVFSVDPPTLFDHFAVNSETGKVTVTKEVNYRNSSNGIVFVVFRASVGDLSSVQTATINIRDLNNFAPTFLPPTPNNTYYTSISESAPKDFAVFEFNAEDRDGNDTLNGQVEFTLRRGGNGKFYIMLRSGIVKVKGETTLDKDEQNLYAIVVEAKDKANSGKSSTATLSVDITDANNKPPEFLQLVYIFSVRENEKSGVQVGIVTAVDIDLNPRITYSFANNAVFEKAGSSVQLFYDLKEILAIDNNGLITVVGNIDRTKYDQISFNVIATDENSESGVQTAIASVLVAVRAPQDPNVYFISPGWTKENPFIEARYTEERLSNSSIVSLRAIDPLTASDVTIFEELPGSDPKNYFAISKGDIFTTRSIDFEALPGSAPKILQVVVYAMSQDRQRTGTATVNIEIIDLNDNAPQFTNLGPYTFNIPEDKVYSYEIGRLVATDKDSGSSGHINYTYIGSPDFSIYTKTEGTLQVAVLIIAEGANLDYSIQPEYNVQVKATDNFNSKDEVQLSTNADIRIRLIDRNNNRPIFRQEIYRFDVIGTKPVNQQFGAVVADDKDTEMDGTVTYSIETATNNGMRYFKIVTEVGGTFGIGKVLNTGHFVVQQPLVDLPDRSEFVLNVVARDNGIDKSLSSNATVIITVNKGVKDPKPKWSAGLKSRVQIEEHSEIGREVYRVTATPANLTSSITYSFVSAGNKDGDFKKFKIDQTNGLITVAQDLDFEQKKLYNEDERPFFTLLILATDTSNSSLYNQFLLIVEITDIDDNIASFTACKNVKYPVPVLVSVSESVSVNTFVYKAVACDNDQPPFNYITYSWFVDRSSQYCKADVQSKFRLDADSGRIFTKVELNREDTNEYLLCIEASKRSGGNNPRQIRALKDDLINRDNHDKVLYVRLIVLDENDNGPKFILPVDKNVILAYPSVEIDVAEANDPDLPPNNSIRYSIEKITFTIAGKSQEAPTAFNINSNDGALSVGINDYTDYVDGYFTVIIKAEDFNGYHSMTDKQTRKIYVTNRANQVRVVFDRPADTIVDGLAKEMVKELNGLETGLYYEIKTISYHVVSNDQDPSFSQTDVCMVVVQEETVMAANTAVKRFNDVAAVKAVLEKYGAVDPGPCDPARSVYPVGWESYWWVLVAFAIFIFVCTCILIFMIVVLYRQYKNYMDSRRTYMVPGN